MCWRVVRIEGDGSVKLILEDMYEQCNDTVGKDLNNNGTYFTGNWSDGQIYLYNGYDDFFADFINYTEENGLQYSFKTFQNTLLSAIDETYNRTTLEDKLKIDEWCYDNVITETVETCYDEDEDGEDLWCYDKEYYGAYTRIEINKEPSLKCTGTKITNFNDEDNTDMYVGTLTADEVSFAGGYNEGNSDYYLMNDYDLMNEEDDDKWFTLSPLSYWEEGYAFSVNYLGSLDEDEVFYDGYSRPAVTLRSDSLISEGIGTQDRPYVIE